MITGVRYLTAILVASRAVAKQSPGVAGAITTSGDSPLRPYSAISRSACSVLVGMPVDGPARWMSQTISGSSTAVARPMVSDFRHMPGPDVLVTPSAPPRAAPTPLISSSAWNVRIPNRLYLDSSCKMSEAGVIGYDPRNICSPASLAAVTSPFASAVLPVMLRYRPGGRVAGLISYWTENSSVVSP